uniref:Putative dna/rna non-specific endonuclease n=1 Tax=Haematobia irritans TaxID=7368 RepID=A0A1L8EC91_HAEIR
MAKLLLALTWSCALAIVVNACSITLPQDVKGFAPVILTRSSAKGEYQLFKPTGKTTDIPEGTQLLLACTGKKNIIESLNKETLELKCSSNKFKDNNNNAYNLKDLVCKSIPSSTLKVTSTLCSKNRGKVFEIGFELNKKFYGPVFDICYDNNKETTYYTHNIINGAAINYNIQESTRRPFSAEGMKLKTTKTYNLYTKKNQVERFSKLIAPSQKYFDDASFLARGHLTPDADFVFGYEQLSTYYYANVAPEFQNINAGNWLRVEELARKVAGSYGKDIESYNGYIGLVQLPKPNGKLVDIYLDDEKKIEAPKYYFKVLLHKPSDAGIVYVTVNDPFIKKGPSHEFCKNVCDSTDLVHPKFPELTKGYTFCCKVDEFKQKFDGLPSDVKASKLLKSK